MDAVTAKAATVLIVEDSPDQAELLQQRLEGAGYKVIAARDGAEGIAAARATHPDAVVTDVNMPVMDGYGLCRAIRDDEALKLTPVILLTVLSDPTDVIRGLAAGADAYLAKPYKLSALLSRIETLIACPLAAPPQVERRKLEVRLDGATHFVDANGPRMLSLMVSAYENSVIQNEDLATAQQVLKDLNEHLEQKVSEKTAALRESETQLYNALKIGRMAHWEYNFATDRFTFNDHFYAIFRTTAQKVGGYTLSTAEYAKRFVYPDDAPVVAKETMAAMESTDPKYSRELEHRIIYEDGEIGHVVVRFIAVKDTQGRAVKTFGVIQDITARKRAEREAEFKSTVIVTQQDTSPDGILLVNENARILSYNRKFVELWGIPEELVQTGNDETVLQWVVHQIQEPDAFIAKIRRLYEDREAKSRDQVQTRHGRTVDRYSAPVVAPNGIYYGRVWYFRDITERVRTEQTIRDSEEKFRGAVDQSPVGIIMIQDGRFIYANPTALAMFGYDTDEFMQLTPAQLVANSERTKLIKDLRQIQAEEIAAVNETYKGLRKDGSVIDVEAHGTKMELGGQPALTCILMDVTEPRRAQRRVQESEAKLKAILDAVTDGIAVADPTTHALDSANNAFCNMLGYLPEELVGLRVNDIHPPESLRDVLTQFEQQARGEITIATNVPTKRKDGSVFFADIKAASAVIDDKPRLVGVFHDVTARRANELALRKVNRALKTLSAGNEALVHTTDESELLARMCRTIVEIGGYYTAWVVYAREDEAKSVEIMACTGSDEAKIRQARLSWGDNEFGQSLTGTAIRVGERQLLRGLQTASRLAPWRELWTKSRATSMLALPLLADGERPFGAIGIIAAEPDAFDEEECNLLEELSRDLAFGVMAIRTRHDRRVAAEKLREGLEDSIQAIAATVEARDPYTGGHERRVAQIATEIAREMGLDEDRVHGLHLAGVVHDLGKISVPAEILSKPGRLSEIEFALVKTHPQSGYEILKNVEFPWPIAQIVLQHHERMDGSGYPQGLKGEAILLEARILSVADVVEAMSSHRPYRAGLGIEVGLAEIEKGSGARYDPQVVEACLRLFREKDYTITN